jgi:hypothetical protein
MNEFEDKLQNIMSSIIDLIKQERINLPKVKFQMVKPENEVRAAIKNHKLTGLDLKTLHWFLYEDEEGATLKW